MKQVKGGCAILWHVSNFRAVRARAVSCGGTASAGMLSSQPP
jgi:hypothetical protein